MGELPDPPSLHRALATNTGFLITRMGMVAHKRFSDTIAPLGLTPRMWGALNVLDSEGAITQHALCKCIGMDPSSMVATIDELEAKGLVERQRHPQDRRAHALHVTAEGRRTLTEGRKLAHRAQDELLAPLTAEQRDQLHALLLALACGEADAPATGQQQTRAAAGGA